MTVPAEQGEFGSWTRSLDSSLMLSRMETIVLDTLVIIVLSDPIAMAPKLCFVMACPTDFKSEHCDLKKRAAMLV